MKTAGELAAAIGAQLEGEAAIELAGVASPERASSGDLIFVDATKHVGRAVASASHCVVVPEGISIVGKTLLRAKDAKFAFVKAAALLRELPVIAQGVHPTAIIAPLAKISPSASIGPYTVIGEDTRIGRHVAIAQARHLRQLDPFLVTHLSLRPALALPNQPKRLAHQQLGRLPQRLCIKDQDAPRPLQHHLCEGRQRLEDRGPSLVRGAAAAEVNVGVGQRP